MIGDCKCDLHDSVDRGESTNASDEPLQRGVLYEKEIKTLSSFDI